MKRKNAKANLKFRGVFAFGMPFFFAVKDPVADKVLWVEVLPGQAMATLGLTGCFCEHVVRASARATSTPRPLATRGGRCEWSIPGCLGWRYGFDATFLFRSQVAVDRLALSALDAPQASVRMVLNLTNQTHDQSPLELLQALAKMEQTALPSFAGFGADVVRRRGFTYCSFSVLEFYDPNPNLSPNPTLTLTLT